VGVGGARLLLTEAEFCRHVARQDETASVAAPGDVRPRQHSQGRHPNEPSFDEASQGEVGGCHNFQVCELKPLRAVDHVGLQSPEFVASLFPARSLAGMNAMIRLHRQGIFVNALSRVPSRDFRIL
jgi:hypothetical protein